MNKILKFNDYILEMNNFAYLKSCGAQKSRFNGTLPNPTYNEKSSYGSTEYLCRKAMTVDSVYGLCGKVMCSFRMQNNKSKLIRNFPRRKCHSCGNCRTQYGYKGRNALITLETYLYNKQILTKETIFLLVILSSNFPII